MAFKIEIDIDELLKSKNPEELGDWEDEVKTLLQLIHMLVLKHKNEPEHYVGQLRQEEIRMLKAIIKDLDTKSAKNRRK
jgi:transcription elongation factor GreA-like protein